MWHLFYNVVLFLASPVILVILLAKQRCRRGLLQRLGLQDNLFGWSRLSRSFGGRDQEARAKRDQPNEPKKPVIWLHAVSLGEAVAITPLVKELQRRHPDCRFVVSTVTETGREAVEQRLAGVAEHLYAPLDFPWVVSRLVTRLRPVLYLFVETELWPNLLRDLHRRKIPTIMVNGRLSSQSFARQQWGPVRLFYRSMLQRLSLCLMQSDRDAERIIALGAEPRVVRRIGNIKFDQPMPASAGTELNRASLGLQDQEQLLVAGSTHPGEEEALVDCYRSLITRVPSAVLLLAPRHIERAEQLEGMIRARGLAPQRRSAMRAAPSNAQSNVQAGPRVIILDSRGELAMLYREAAVTYVGGTLVPVGGHNLLEPAVWAKPVLFGPYTDHCAEIASLLNEAGGGRRVEDADDLTRQVLHLFEHAEERVAMGQAARRVVEQNQGALRSTVEAIESLLTTDRSGTDSAPVENRVSLMAGR